MPAAASRSAYASRAQFAAQRQRAQPEEQRDSARDAAPPSRPEISRPSERVTRNARNPSHQLVWFATKIVGTDRFQRSGATECGPVDRGEVPSEPGGAGSARTAGARRRIGGGGILEVGRSSRSIHADRRGSSDQTARPRIMSLRGPGDVRPGAKDIVPQPLDAVEDAGVGALQQPHGETGTVLGEEPHHAIRCGEERAGASDLESHEGDGTRPSRWRRFQGRAIHAEPGELVGGQVDAARRRGPRRRRGARW